MPAKGQSDHDKGYLYIMSNKSNPNIIKMGLSRDPCDREKSLSNTSQPSPFELERVYFVDDMKNGEEIMHTRMRDHRINDNREHFNLVTQDAHEEAILQLPTQFNTEDIECSAIDLPECYIQTISERIEDSFDLLNETCVPMNIEAMKEEHKAAKREKRTASYRVS